MADTTKALIDALDEAALSLLEHAEGVSNEEGVSSEGKNDPPVPFSERTKAFAAVVEWVKERSKIAPEKNTKEPTIARLKSQLNSGTPSGGRTAARPAKAVRAANGRKDAGSIPDAAGSA